MCPYFRIEAPVIPKRELLNASNTGRGVHKVVISAGRHLKDIIIRMRNNRYELKLIPPGLEVRL